MSKKNDGGPACGRCGGVGARRQGRQWLCAIHYRFGQMRSDAKRRGKAVPSCEQLSELLLSLDDMQCPHCSRPMNWLRETGASTQVTLQHYRSGTFGLICLACNTRHGQMEGDSFCDLPADHKRCPGCLTLKPLSDFRTDNSTRWANKQSYCKTCANARMRRWVANNREHVNAKQREGRRRRGEVAG